MACATLDAECGGKDKEGVLESQREVGRKDGNPWVGETCDEGNSLGQGSGQGSEQGAGQGSEQGAGQGSEQGTRALQAAAKHEGAKHEQGTSP